MNRLEKKFLCKICKAEIEKGTKCKSCRDSKKSPKTKIVIEQMEFPEQKEFDPQPGG